MKQFMVGARAWMAGGVSAALLAGALCIGPAASAQDQSAATPKDVIFARKILMDLIGRHMDDLEGMTSSGKIDLAEGHDHVDSISVMLMAFPHLFPPNSNEWKPNVERDPGRDTFAAPELWTNYADFYKRAAAASKVAYEASRADKPDQFKTIVGELRLACDSCHGIYFKQP